MSGYVRVSDLRRDARYQQQLNARHLQQLARALDPRVVGVAGAAAARRRMLDSNITVNRRSGELYIVDGSYRLAALRTSGVTHIPKDKLRIVELDAEDEVRLFVGLNRKIRE